MSADIRVRLDPATLDALHRLAQDRKSGVSRTAASLIASALGTPQTRRTTAEEITSATHRN